MIGELLRFAESAGSVLKPISPNSANIGVMRTLALFTFLLIFLGVADAKPDRCRHSRALARVDACPLFDPRQAWLEVRTALGIYQAERFGAADECATRAEQLARSWRLLRLVELPGIGNAAGYVDRQIANTAFDPGLGAAVPAQYVQGRRTLLLGPAFFDLENVSDAERAAVLLHEARHAAPGGYHHTICGAASTMAWRVLCDRRFSADLVSDRAGPWSLEVVFLSLLGEVQRCIGRDYLETRIQMRLAGAFGRVDAAERKALRAAVMAARNTARAKNPD